MSTALTRQPYGKSSGFTLIEIAVVMLIITILMAGLVPTISTQMEQKGRNETRKKLDEAKEALIGYAIVYGRLPCPASSVSGVESFAAAGNAINGNCSNFNNGFLPAATLGLSELDSKGFLVDGWNNRIRYAVTSSNANAFTSLNQISTTGISALTPNLLVCSTASIDHISCPAGTALTTGTPVVIYSTGANGGYGGTSADEAENPNPNSVNNDLIFVSHDNTPNFDDQVIWISPNILFSRMIAAGKLP